MICENKNHSFYLCTTFKAKIASKKYF